MRESGILMPVSSLPGPYGIGCFGTEAETFVDFLAAAGQKIWQILPLSPTGYGDSPYQSCSAFAGNPYFIDLDALKAEGLLTAAQLKAESWGEDPLQVDYGTLYTSRYKILRAAYAAWRRQCEGLHGCAHYYPDAYYAFTLENESWLEDYALYMALKTANQMKSWTEWPRAYRMRDGHALAAFRAEHEEEIGFWKFLQYEFAIQWKKLKAYANAKGIQILGDIPIYVSADSVDAWVGGPLFELAADGSFARVAGCPPGWPSRYRSRGSGRCGAGRRCPVHGGPARSTRHSRSRGDTASCTAGCPRAGRLPRSNPAGSLPPGQSRRLHPAQTAGRPPRHPRNLPRHRWGYRPGSARCWRWRRLSASSTGC